jgi:hypothetical protein
MNVGDLVRYQIRTEVSTDLGIVIAVLSDEERPHGDNLLVQWPDGKRWCCEGKWLEHLSSVPCNRSWHVVL